MQVNLVSTENVFLMFIILETSNNETKHLLLEAYGLIVVEDDDWSIDLSCFNHRFFDVFQLVSNNLIDNTLEERFEIVLLVSKKQKKISPLVFQVLRIDKHQSVTDTD
jgi:hypothetical protein